ncbi:putative membrane protein YgcG [Stackebrandtia albiflava]|uniref:Putative membrane protein YgcG n=1 Tax=Stackebrandtia albiflava TaxID=406432 RepID=A0A562V3Q7_9ACTN|nr:TPM domain-containing protein [Stackebrandtia albiflava]TWJ12447.1 putative membrane protein YgcG [Stackebrandtia albiflava]
MSRFAAAVAATAAAGVLLTPVSAVADDPVRLSPGQVTDRAGVLGERESEVVTALDDLSSDQGVQLFVVYVSGFSGTPPQEWADRTAIDNGLGRSDALLAVAVADRQYAVSVDEGFPLSDAELDEVAQVAIEPALRENDWAGAAVGAARGYDAALSGEPIPAVSVRPGEPVSDSGGTAAWWLLGALLVVAALLALWWWRRRGRARREAPAERPALALPDLDKAASRMLLETDDAVRTSEQELGFAVAEFGEESAARFSETLTVAKRELHDAFLIRQRLDDSEPEDEPTRRRMLDEIIERCKRANARLDAVAADFDRLRDVVARAPEAVEALDGNVTRVGERLTTARATAERLASEYPASATQGVDGNVGAAADRLDFAGKQATAARASITEDATGRAAVLIRAGEEAVAQAEQLLTAIERRDGELRQAAAGLPGLLAEVDKDVAEAEAAGESANREGLAQAAAAARSTAESVRMEQSSGRLDPLAATRRLEEADEALDTALADLRDARARRRRAAAQLDQVSLSAASAVEAAEDFVNTNRGGVATAARTRLAEARNLLDRSRATAETDPVSALADAQRAARLADEAARLAQRDVEGFYRTTPGGFTGGGFGGGGGSAGAVLGGILIGGLLGGGRGGRMGGGPMVPGSFGGGGTRGRRGAGGRF